MDAMELMALADAMIKAADGYADDELCWFREEQWSAGRLREEADDLIDDNIDAWTEAKREIGQ